MSWFKSLGYKLWLLWYGIEFTNVFKSIFTAFGMLWLLIEALSFFNKPEFSENVKSIWWVFLILGIIWVIYDNWPKMNYSAPIKGKDVEVCLQIGDVFKTDGALIVPVNNRLDIDNQGIVKRSSSILRYFIQNVYKDVNEHLETDIKNSINDNQKWYDNFILSKSEPTYKIGTTVPIFRDEKQYYLLCSSTLNAQNRSKCTEEDLRNSLIELWAYLSQCGSKDSIVIPIIGTGRGRISMKREEVIKEIVLSFLASISSDTHCEKLTICIHPSDVKKYRIDIISIYEFIRLHCLNSNFINVSQNSSQNVGNVIN